MFEDGSYLQYDVLSLNIGTKTKLWKTIKGVWEYSFCTRPIKEMF